MVKHHRWTKQHLNKKKSWKDYYHIKLAVEATLQLWSLKIHTSTETITITIPRQRRVVFFSSIQATHSSLRCINFGSVFCRFGWCYFFFNDQLNLCLYGCRACRLTLRHWIARYWVSRVLISRTFDSWDSRCQLTHMRPTSSNLGYCHFMKHD